MSETLSFNGSLVAAEAISWGTQLLHGRIYLYQAIHTRAHQAIHLDQHLEILRQALHGAWGLPLKLNAKKVQSEIAELLTKNRYPKEGNLVWLYVWPQRLGSSFTPQASQDDSIDYLMHCGGQLLYPEYTTWHKRMMLGVLPCEYLWMGYPSSIARQVADYGRQVAQRESVELVVIENTQGVLTNVDDEPLYVVMDQQLITSPLEAGATDSVMRRLIVEACTVEGIPVREIPLERTILEQCEEVFTASTQGLVSMEGYLHYRYFNLMANRLTPVLNRLSKVSTAMS